ncbi:5-methylcytosine-specific restriction endonuclease McrA [Kaistia soli DSM 19436]|uniref:Putative HNH nuclease YajD n=1 Tax=Kaistia soli DSM 19436 TaxID=1122133 RepID=A0A1M4YGE5_9HYPH|nr:HNH endonuclease [Kaistia soli]SHF04810.1 5-methylcytosine-specific restriction endonuclease McrA [Kaistia soli DSM 19436]
MRSRREGVDCHLRSAEAKVYRAFYASPVWKALRAEALGRDLFTCQRCRCTLVQGKSRDRHTPTVHHIIPHKGDRALFFDLSNLESVCKGCHDKRIQIEETRGTVLGHDGNGRPVDPEHPWNRLR